MPVYRLILSNMLFDELIIYIYIYILFHTNLITVISLFINFIDCLQLIDYAHLCPLSIPAAPAWAARAAPHIS